MPHYPSHRRWGFAWLGLVAALALHVTDEAVNGFLPLYNQVVTDARRSMPWFPMPTFTFDGWLSGLVTGILGLLALSPLVFAGHRWLRPAAYVFSTVMAANAVGHAAASIYSWTWAPGVYSSPVMFVAALVLFTETRRLRASAPS
jgi:hypothetical protein